MIALDGKFGYDFILGVVAAINPCGFVMLPAFLMYYLGLEGSRPGTQRASVQRALVVSASTSGGFIAVFLVVGTITRLFTSTLQDNAKYVALVIGLSMVVLGCFLLAGWKPSFAVPQLGVNRERRQTVASMFLFGVAYAVASIGCSLGFLAGAVFSTFSSHGFVSGLVAVTWYGIGMGMLVTALTVTLAFASGGLLRVLRRGLPYIDMAAAIVVIGTGLYLAWYWYRGIRNSGSDRLTTKVEGWQANLQDFIQRQGAWKLAIIFGVVVALGIVVATHHSRSSRSSARTAGGSDGENAVVDPVNADAR